MCLFGNLLFSNGKSQTKFEFPAVAQLDTDLLEVYDGDHFRDIATYTNGTFQLPTLLVLYKRPCKARAQRMGLLVGLGSSTTFPPPTFLTYASHNYESWKKDAWFRYSETQDVATLHNITSCPTALFWEGGSSSKSEPTRWTEQHQLPFRTWFKTKLVRSVTLRNDAANYDAEFLLEGDVDKVILVEAGSEKQAQVPAAWEAPVIARRSQSNEILHAWYVRHNDQVLPPEKFHHYPVLLRHLDERSHGKSRLADGGDQILPTPSQGASGFYEGATHGGAESHREGLHLQKNVTETLPTISDPVQTGRMGGSAHVPA